MADILAFPRRPAQPKPDRVRLNYDFSRWCVEYFAGDRFLRRTSFDSKIEACLQINALVRFHGLTALPDGKPDWTDSYSTEPDEDDDDLDPHPPGRAA